MSEDNNKVLVEDLSSKMIQKSSPSPAVEPEAPVEESPAKDPKQELFSTKFANLSRKERELLEKEKTIKSQYSEIERLNSIKGSAKEKVNEALEFLGLSLNDVIQYELSKIDQEMLEDDDSIEGRYKKLEKKLAAIEQKEQEALLRKQEEEARKEQEYIEETISAFKNEINGFLQERADTYELIAVQQAHDQVFEVIEENFRLTGQVMPIEEAANLVEAYFEEEAKRILAQSKKLKAVLPVDEAMSQAQEVIKASVSKHQETVNGAKSRVSPTLTQDIVTQPANAPSRPLSREESLRRAAQKLKWN